MKLLLDTHSVAWFLAEPSRLPPRWIEAIRAADAVLLSAVVAWEVEVKRLAGRWDVAPAASIRAALEDVGFSHLPITWSHAAASAALPRHHGDPFDRLLVAQAIEEDAVLVTADRDLRAYDVEVLPTDEPSGDDHG